MLALFLALYVFAAKVLVRARATGFSTAAPKITEKMQEMWLLIICFCGPYSHQTRTKRQSQFYILCVCFMRRNIYELLLNVEGNYGFNKKYLSVSSGKWSVKLYENWGSRSRRRINIA